MKLLFKNVTEYTKENYNAFIRFHQKKYGTKTLIKLGIISLCIVYIIISNILYFNWKLLIGFIVLGFIFGVMYHQKLKKQTQENKKMIKDKKKIEFYFYPRYIKIKYGRKFERVLYFKLYKVFETKEYFFLYTDETHSLILSKDGFEIGSEKEFAEFIKKKCLLKYKKEK